MTKKLTIFQIITIVVFILFLVWEKNMQDYLRENGLESTGETRMDLFVILPLLAVMIGVSVWQYFKNM